MRGEAGTLFEVTISGTVDPLGSGRRCSPITKEPQSISKAGELPNCALSVRFKTLTSGTYQPLEGSGQTSRANDCFTAYQY